MSIAFLVVLTKHQMESTQGRKCLFWLMVRGDTVHRGGESMKGEVAGNIVSAFGKHSTVRKWARIENFKSFS